MDEFVRQRHYESAVAEPSRPSPPVLMVHWSVGRFTLAVSTMDYGEQYGQLGSVTRGVTVRLTRNPGRY